MASEDVSHHLRTALPVVRDVLNAGWRLRMFHVANMLLSDFPELVLNAGWRLRMFHTGFSFWPIGVIIGAQRRMASEDVSLKFARCFAYIATGAQRRMASEDVSPAGTRQARRLPASAQRRMASEDVSRIGIDAPPAVEMCSTPDGV